MQGIVDRIEDEKYVVILFESENKKVVKEKDNLPNEICHPDAVIEADLNDDELTNIKYLANREKKRREKLEKKRERLSERLENKD
jgi:hypothetical protein